MTILNNILLHAFLNFLVLGSAAGLIVGAILILRPHWLERVSLVANRWVSTRALNKSMERTIEFDRWFYRYRLFGGGFTLLGALYLLYFFTVTLDKAAAIAGIAKHFHVPVAYIGVLFDPLVLIALLGATFALFVSLFVLFRPSQLREFEKVANQWVSMRQTLKPLEVPRSGVDEFALRHASKTGAVLVMGSLYALVLLTWWAR
jgi:hypothetical protein